MRTILILTLCTIAAVALASLATAEVPQRINYQGLLTDSSGNPVTGSYQIKFTIWDDPIATAPANEKWTSGEQSVQVTDGSLIYELGSVVQLPNDLFATDTVRWLGIKVGTDAEITPRTRLTSVPYAYQALRADTADFALGSGNWSVTGSVLFTNEYWGIARGGAGNVLYGDSTHTMINLGVASTTGNAAKQDGAYATVSGGLGNTASGDYSTVSGGWENTANGRYSTICGGAWNNTIGERSTVGGGWYNLAEGLYSTVGGGLWDTASGINSTVPGGLGNTASGNESFAAGENAKALHHNTFVWSDGAEGRQDFESTGPNQFLIQATGGVGIGTADPQAPLHVGGTIQGEAAFYFDENADLGYDNAVIGFNYADPVVLCDRRLRVTAGKDDNGDNNQGASIDLHGNQWELYPKNGDLDLVAGEGITGLRGDIRFFTGTGDPPLERMCITWGGNVGIGTQEPGERLTIRGTLEQIDNVDQAFSTIGRTMQGAGAIETYGANGLSNVIASHPVDGPDRGYVGVRGAGGVVEKAVMNVCPHNTGWIYTLGDDNSFNVNIGHNANNVNLGLLTVFDDARSGTEQAGIYVDTLGNGIVWGDQKSFRMANPDQPGTDIWYTCPEGPEAAAYIRGTGHLENGKAVITFPDHFRTVANPEGITVQLTPLSAESRGLAVVEKGLDRLVVRELSNGGGTYDFDYLVMAVRKGYGNYQVIRLSTEGKAPEVVKSAEILLSQ